MVNDYAAPVLKLVQETSNNRSGIKKLVDVTEAAIIKVDQDIAELLMQRNSLVTIHEQFTGIYKVLVGEELRTKQQLDQISIPPSGSTKAEDMRRIVLEFADILQHKGEVRNADIMWELNNLPQPLPWKNPKAVVATILNRSGKWEKKSSGTYTKRKEE